MIHKPPIELVIESQQGREQRTFLVGSVSETKFDSGCRKAVRVIADKETSNSLSLVPAINELFAASKSF